MRIGEGKDSGQPPSPRHPTLQLGIWEFLKKGGWGLGTPRGIERLQGKYGGPFREYTGAVVPY